MVDEDWGDGEPGVGGAELFLDSLGQLGEGASMIPKDGQFAYLDLDVSAYPPCTLRVFVLGWDITGQEGYPDSLDIEITVFRTGIRRGSIPIPTSSLHHPMSRPSRRNTPFPRPEREQGTGPLISLRPLMGNTRSCRWSD